MAGPGESAQGPPGYTSQSARTLRGDRSASADIQTLQEQLRRREAEVETLEKTVRQQKATIHAQSQTIQNPRPKASHFHQTPQRQTTGHLFSTNSTRQASGNIMRSGGQLTSVFDTPANIPQQSYGHSSSGSHPQSMTTRSSTAQSFHNQQRPNSTNDWGSPAPRQIQYINTPAQQTPTCGRGIPFHIEQLQSPNPSTGLARSSDIAPAADIKQSFECVFDMAQKFALAHVNQPNANADAAMPQNIKDRIIKAAPGKNAAALMNTTQTRHWLVTKIIIYWIVKNVLKAETFEGFAQDVDEEVRSIRKSLYETMPAQLRHHYLNNVNTALRQMRSRPGFVHFFERKSRERGNQLWAIVKPMMHFKTSRDWDDLLELMKTFHQLAEKMYTGAEEYQFNTPPVGTFFSSSDMIDKTACLSHLSAHQLQGQHATVTLAISPRVNARNESGTKTIIPATVMSKLPNMPG